jgi:transcription initiation factor IIF auxiliary subunit
MVRKSATLVLLLLIGTSLWAADRDVSIASVVVSAGKPWPWVIYITGSPEALGHIKCVQYLLEPSFPNASRTICSRGSEERPFQSSGTTWGQFKLSATVTFDDGSVQHLHYVLNPENVNQPSVSPDTTRVAPSYPPSRKPEVLRFGEVNDHLYRGGAVSQSALKELKAMKVTKIIDLREPGHGTNKERAWTEALGMQFDNSSLRSDRVPTVEEIRRLLVKLNSSKSEIIYAHDWEGKDRIGVVIACYRIQYDRWTTGDALKEAQTFGLSNSGMIEFIKRFSALAP